MIERPDAIVCDLDGVLYRGEVEVPGAGETLNALHGAGIDVVFVTNNASKTSAEAAAKIQRLTGFAAETANVLTSAQAAVHLIEDKAPPTLLFGAPGARTPLEEAGVDTVVELAKRNPANLYDKVVDVNQKKKLNRKLPTQRQVEDWVRQAKKLPRVVSY